MLRFLQFFREDMKKQGELISAIQDLRKQSQLHQMRDNLEMEKHKLKMQIKRRKEREKIGNR